MSSVKAKPESLDVVVIGGSIAGLMAGILLRNLGHKVQILEQSELSERKEQGAGLTIGPQVQELLSKYDSIKEPYSIDCPGIQYLDGESKRSKFVKRPMQFSSWNTLYYLLRANFDGFKSEFHPDAPAPPKLGEAQIQLGAKVTNVTYDKTHVNVEYTNVSDGTAKSVNADLVIAADGTSSAVRQLLLPEIKRDYAGYLCWRGNVDEEDVEPATREILQQFFNANTYSGGYILNYIVPGDAGSLEVGKRRFNWVWYSKCDEASEEFTQILTDSDGKQHRNTVPRGKVRKDVWEKQRAYGNDILNPVFRELINKTAEPFVTVIQDHASPQAAFFDGKLLLLGDALAVSRPHMGVGVNTAGVDCLLLEKLMKGEINLKTWEKEVVLHGHRTRLINVAFGNWYLYGGAIFAKSLLAYIWSLLPFSSFVKSTL